MGDVYIGNASITGIYSLLFQWRINDFRVVKMKVQNSNVLETQ